MATNQYGFDPERDAWSRDATERLLPPLLEALWSARRIEFAWRSGMDRLDTQYGVDCLVETPRRQVALAVRLRGVSYYRRYGDITIRYDSLQNLGKALEMQKSIARFLFYGWCDTDRPKSATRLVDWHILWLQRIVDQYLAGRLQPARTMANHDGSSRFVVFGLQELRQRGLVLASAQTARRGVLGEEASLGGARGEPAFRLSLAP